MRILHVVGLVSVLFLVNPQSMRAQEAGRVQQLRWMLGQWTQSTSRSITHEIWEDVGGGVFRGSGRVLSAADRVERSRESLLLAEMAGDVYYIAKVKSNPYPVPFKLVDSSAQNAVFENPDHDFPKRLEYRRTEQGGLNVTVSDGGSKSFVIAFTKSDVQKKESTAK
ncbi:MAG: hypothetical protein Fues2KO_02250 [Fuerstiella sp.]